MPVDYKKSGVNVAAGDAFVDWIQAENHAQPHQKNILEGVGGFAAIFKMQFPEIKKPCLVSCTDGVGTKVKLASHFKDFSGIGQDLVAMCINDLICSGARPLFFLDYYATGKLDLDDAKAFLKSVRDACHNSGCALIGGETAEMPGVYQAGDFDCAGFAVGIVDEDDILGAKRVEVGDIVIGIESSGFHSNGYSLVRELFAKDLDRFREQLLKPTHLYAKLSEKLYQEKWVHALAHITGGGIENLPRVLPQFTQVRIIDWAWPDIFIEAQERSGLARSEMLETFNCGMGFCAILPKKYQEQVQEAAGALGFHSFVIGEVEKSTEAGPKVIYS